MGALRKPTNIRGEHMSTAEIIARRNAILDVIPKQGPAKSTAEVYRDVVEIYRVDCNQRTVERDLDELADEECYPIRQRKSSGRGNEWKWSKNTKTRFLHDMPAEVALALLQWNEKLAATQPAEVLEMLAPCIHRAAAVIKGRSLTKYLSTENGEQSPTAANTTP